MMGGPNRLEEPAFLRHGNIHYLILVQIGTALKRVTGSDTVSQG
jgi:hypothetical protein